MIWNWTDTTLPSTAPEKFLDVFYYSVQFSSVAQLCPTFWEHINCSMPGLPVLYQLVKSIQTHVHCVGDDIQLSHPSSCPSPTSLNLFQHQGLFKWVGTSHQVAKVLEFCFIISFSISPSNEHPGLISFRMDWLDFLAVQGTLKSLLQHHSSKASILWCSPFFRVQISNHTWPLEKPQSLLEGHLLTK